MRRLWLLLVLALTGTLHASVALDPTKLPSLPTEPPPTLAAGPGAPVPNGGQSIAAAAGWQFLSFPVGRLQAVSGLQRMLLRRGATGLEAVDPVNHPETVDTGVAYLAYFDQPGTIVFTGSDTTAPHRTTLYAGWNMIGCPSSRPIQRQTISLTRPGGTTSDPAHVASDATTPGAAWLYSRAYGFVGGQWRQADLRQPGALLQPGQVGLVFAWQQVELNWNSTPPASGVPVLKSAAPSPAAAGQTVTVAGQNLGEPGRGVLTLGTLPVQPEDIVSWSPTQVQFKVPAGAASGDLQVAVDRHPGNALPFQVKAAPAANVGTLEGQVFSSDGSPLQGAQVLLDDGQQSLSDGQGVFRIPDIPAGSHKAYITLIGYKSASGEVQVNPGTARTLKVSLSPTGGATGGAQSPEKKGTFTVTAYPFNVGREQRDRYWVYRIQVWEYGNYALRWENTWWTDNGDASVYLNCPGAPLGRSYAVIVTWRNKAGDERSNRWTPEIQYDGQTVRYYNPVGAGG